MADYRMNKSKVPRKRRPDLLLLAGMAAVAACIVVTRCL